ncbi:MAG: hypothetical protein Q4D29_04570 [Lachnospiraceae bacterium]|nr:hypothetical protein [Lachnospiraceae bacterium]
MHNILSLCDLSSDDAVLEIKTNNIDIENYKEQLYYESRGRRCFHMGLRWCRNDETFSIESLVFIISEVFVKDSGITIGEWKSNKRELNRIANQLKLQKFLGGKPIRILDYTNTITDIYVECLECGRQWNTTYQRIMSGSIKCEKCDPKIVKPRKSRASGLTEEQKLQERFSKYKEKLYARSNGTITVDSYTGAKDNLNAKCNVCGYQWSPRADHLIDRVKCPCCNKRTKK